MSMNKKLVFVSAFLVILLLDNGTSSIVKGNASDNAGDYLQKKRRLGKVKGNGNGLFTGNNSPPPNNNNYASKSPNNDDYAPKSTYKGDYASKSTSKDNYASKSTYVNDYTPKKEDNNKKHVAKLYEKDVKMYGDNGKKDSKHGQGVGVRHYEGKKNQKSEGLKVQQGDLYGGKKYHGKKSHKGKKAHNKKH